LCGEADAGGTSGDEVEIPNDAFVIQPVMQAGGGDAAAPLGLIIFIGDDSDRARAPDLLAEQRFAGNHRAGNSRRERAFAAPVNCPEHSGVTE